MYSRTYIHVCIHCLHTHTHTHTHKVGEDEEIPEELSMFVVRKSGETSTTSDISGHSSYSEDSIGDSHLDEELKQVQQSLATEQNKSKRLEGEISSLQKELLEVKNRVLELNRKYEDATRAYEQEKRVCVCVCV